MLYELIAIVRPGSVQEVREIARTAGLQVLRSGGVIRGYTNWGTFRLPRPTTKHQARYTEGHHFIMRFDASAPAQAAVQRTLGLDPRMIRFSIIKLGNKLEEIRDVPGTVEWNQNQRLTDAI
ncbi:hypothetical protein VTN31DRAFT_780 [Thermomyces dupontii]